MTEYSAAGQSEGEVHAKTPAASDATPKGAQGRAEDVFPELTGVVEQDFDGQISVFTSVLKTLEHDLDQRRS